MPNRTNRIVRYTGNAREIGLAAGRRLGKRLEKNIDYYLRNRPLRPEALNHNRLCAEAIPMLRTLPARFQEEIEGLAEGAGLPLQKVAEWFAVERLAQDGCSGFVCSIGGRAWVGRNNDFRAPAVWGYVTIKEVNNRIPTINLGVEADVFTAAGINRKQLWLHFQYLPVDDTPRKNREHYPVQIFLTEALETCSDIKGLESLLANVDRDDGMLLFAVDGKADEAVIYECACRKYQRRNPIGNKLMVTNHASNTRRSKISESSASRLKRLSETVGREGWEGARIPEDLIAILADERVEQRDREQMMTVDAAIVCPAEKTLWYTLGGYPAASCGNWKKIEWPW